VCSVFEIICFSAATEFSELNFIYSWTVTGSSELNFIYSWAATGYKWVLAKFALWFWWFYLVLSRGYCCWASTSTVISVLVTYLSRPASMQANFSYQKSVAETSLSRLPFRRAGCYFQRSDLAASSLLKLASRWADYSFQTAEPGATCTAVFSFRATVSSYLAIQKELLFRH